MADTTPKLYEALFLLNQNLLAADPAAVVAHVQGILDKAGAKTHVLRKWDERKLCYSVAGQKRGTFYIAYFDITPTAIAQIERASNLSETILRAMILRAEHVGAKELQDAIHGKSLDEVRAAAQAAAAEEEAAAAA